MGQNYVFFHGYSCNPNIPLGHTPEFLLKVLLEGLGYVGNFFSMWWFQFFLFSSLGRWSNLTNIFQMGWFNHQTGLSINTPLIRMARVVFIPKNDDKKSFHFNSIFSFQPANTLLKSLNHSPKSHQKSLIRPTLYNCIDYCFLQPSLPKQHLQEVGLDTLKSDGRRCYRGRSSVERP